MNILMITALDFWSAGKKAGAPSFYETLRGYSQNGHTVHLVTYEKGEGELLYRKAVETENVLPGVYVHRFKLPINVPWNNLIGRVVRKLRISVLFPVLAALAVRRLDLRTDPDLLYG